MAGQGQGFCYFTEIITSHLAHTPVPRLTAIVLASLGKGHRSTWSGVFSFWDVHCLGVVTTQQTGTYKQSWARVRRTLLGDGNAAYILEIKGRTGFEVEFQTHTGVLILEQQGPELCGLVTRVFQGTSVLELCCSRINSRWEPAYVQG